MKIKVSELTGAALDWAVCRALHPKADMSATHVWLDSGDGEDDFLIEKTSTDWSQGGPIVEREFIGVNPRANRKLVECWSAQFYEGVKNDLYVNEYGPTPLIAAMRCYVASKLGDEVDIPEELC